MARYRSGLGDAIATLDGLALGATAPEGDATFQRYMNEGASVHATYNAAAGLAGDIAMLDGLARLDGQLQAQAPFIREQLIGPHFDPNGSVSGLGAAPYGGNQGAPPVVDKDVRAIFKTPDAYNDFSRQGGDAVVKRLSKQIADGKKKNSPNVPALTHQLAVVRLFRTRTMQALHGILPPWSRGEVVTLWMNARRDAKTTAQLSGLSGLEGLNSGLAGLEGALGRKVRKGLKKGLKAGAKFAAKTAFQLGPMAMGIPIPLPVPKRLR